MPHTIVLQLPENTARRYQSGAIAARKALEDFLMDRLQESVPPSTDDLPEPLSNELRSLERLEDDELFAVARGRLSPAHQRRYERLLHKASGSGLKPQEQAELHELGEEARRLTLQRAHAYLILKWRGHPLPALAELSRTE